MRETTTALVPFFPVTTYGLLRQIADVIGWRTVKADTEAFSIVWKHDPVTSVFATMEPCEQGTRLTISVDRFGAFDSFRRQASILTPLLGNLAKKTRACTNAYEEISRLFEDAGSAKWVLRKDIEQITKKYNVDLDNELRPRMALLYEKHLAICGADGQLCEEDRMTLSHLSHILHLDEETVNRIHNGAKSKNPT